jgi:hypothetical protein
MYLSGFTSNGEFNSLRCRGITRPLSVLQVRADVRGKYGGMRHGKMKGMLSPKRKYNTVGTDNCIELY